MCHDYLVGFGHLNYLYVLFTFSYMITRSMLDIYQQLSTMGVFTRGVVHFLFHCAMCDVWSCQICSYICWHCHDNSEGFSHFVSFYFILFTFLRVPRDALIYFHCFVLSDWLDLTDSIIMTMPVLLYAA